MVGGGFFTLVGALGLLKLKDVFARMHAAGMVDTLGVAMVMVGLMLQATDIIVAFKLFLIMGFIFFTSPTTCYALARAAIHGGVKPQTDDVPNDTPTKEQAPSRT